MIVRLTVYLPITWLSCNSSVLSKFKRRETRKLAFEFLLNENLPSKTFVTWLWKLSNSNGVKNPKEPKWNAITGGTDCWNSRLAYNRVPSPPRHTMKSILSWKYTINQSLYHHNSGVVLSLIFVQKVAYHPTTLDARNSRSLCTIVLQNING